MKVNANVMRFMSPLLSGFVKTEPFDATQQQTTQPVQQRSSIKDVISSVLFSFGGLLLLVSAIVLHYRCNNGISWGIIPAVLIAPFYLFFYLIDYILISLSLKNNKCTYKK